MIKQLETANDNVLALEVIDGLTDADEQLCQQLFNEKLAQGNTQVNLLVKLDQWKLKHSSSKAFREDIVFVMKNVKKIKHLAIVGHSKTLKKLVPVDNFFFEKVSKGSKERYFDVTEIDDAYTFVNGE